jgi:hypothetical protein
MQAKQKVTLYLSPELHRQLKIRSAIDSEPMSELAARAIIFYLANPEVVDEVEASQGRNYRVYACPECETSVVLREGKMISLRGQPGVIEQDQLSADKVQEAEQEGKEELVPC